VCDAWTQHGGGPTAHPRSSRSSTIAVEAARAAILAPFAEVEPALLLVFCTNLAWRRSFLSAQQRTAAHSCFGTQLRKLLRQSCKMLGTLRQSCKMLGAQFLTRSVREMIDFLMSICPRHFVSTPIKHQTSLIYLAAGVGSPLKITHEAKKPSGPSRCRSLERIIR